MHPIDLHTHSTRSNGTYTPTELVQYAALKGLSAIALTDHDTIDGIE
jgi:predicted metal-dependent phosphoesterase TrpH